MTDLTNFYPKYRELVLEEVKKNEQLKGKIMAMYITSIALSPVIEKIRFVMDSGKPLSEDLKKELAVAKQQCLGFTHHADIDQSTKTILKSVGQKMANEDLTFIEDLNFEMSQYFGRDLARLQGIFETCKVKALSAISSSE